MLVSAPGHHRVGVGSHHPPARARPRIARAPAPDRDRGGSRPRAHGPHRALERPRTMPPRPHPRWPTAWSCSATTVGTPVPFELSIVDLLDDPTVEGYVISAHDASSQVHTERDLTRTLSLLTATLDSTADGIIVVQSGGSTSPAATAASPRSGRSPRTPSVWAPRPIPARCVSRSTSSPSTRQGFTALRVEAPRGARGRESRHPRVQGRARGGAAPRRPRRVHGKVVGRVLEVGPRRHRARPPRGRARPTRPSTTPSTGWPTRHSSRTGSSTPWPASSQTGAPLAVLFIDLDDFKTVNDSSATGRGTSCSSGWPPRWSSVSAHSTRRRGSGATSLPC